MTGETVSDGWRVPLARRICAWSYAVLLGTTGVRVLAMLLLFPVLPGVRPGALPATLPFALALTVVEWALPPLNVWAIAMINRLGSPGDRKYAWAGRGFLLLFTFIMSASLYAAGPATGFVASP